MRMKRMPIEHHAEGFKTTGHLSLNFGDVVCAVFDAEPEHARRAARWKHTYILKRGRERSRVNASGERCDDGRHGGLADLAEENQRQVHVRGIDQLQRSFRPESLR